MRVYEFIIIVIYFILFGYIPPTWSQQADAPPAEQEANMAVKEQLKITFIADSKELAKNSEKNNLAWINVVEQVHLVFKRSNKGSIFRGNAILFHSQGENPIHNRLINPLSIQLSNLGWNTFSANIGLPDFPIELEINGQTEQNPAVPTGEDNPMEESTSNPGTTSEASKVDTQSKEPLAEEKEPKNFFKTPKSYQEYFSLLCQETIKLVTISNEPTIFLANGEAGYWVLDCLKQMPPSTPIVLIQPKTPTFSLANFESTLESFNNPLFTIADEDSEDHFVKLIKRRKWQSSIQRINHSALQNTKINIENITIAKLISGWIKTINTKSQ